MDYLFFIVIPIIALFLFSKLISTDSLKGAMLGSKISRTTGEIPIKTNGLTSQVVRIHKLENGNIGVEYTQKALYTFSVRGFALSPNQADQLMLYLQQAK